MSELLVNTIKKADGTGSLSVPAESGTVVTTASPSLGRRNLIINGAMQVAQRGTVTGLTSSSYGGADRFELSIASAGTWTMSQSTTAPEGFANSLKLDCTASAASPTILQLLHRFEGQNLQHLKKGTSNALPLTLTFWIRSNKTGDIQVNFRDNDNDRMISSVVTISSADTFEYKTITIDGDTVGAFDNDNGSSFMVEWFLDSSSSTYTSGTTPTAWETKANADRGAGTTIALADSTANELYITGVQLEVGSVATPFEHRSYGEELALCQRYYQKLGEVNYANLGSGMIGSSVNTTAYFYIKFTTTMRSNPSYTHQTLIVTDRTFFDAQVTSINNTQSCKDSMHVQVSFSASGTTKQPVFLAPENLTNGFIALDAEL